MCKPLSQMSNPTGSILKEETKWDLFQKDPFWRRLEKDADFLDWKQVCQIKFATGLGESRTRIRAGTTEQSLGSSHMMKTTDIRMDA